MKKFPFTLLWVLGVLFFMGQSAPAQSIKTAKDLHQNTPLQSLNLAPNVTAIGFMKQGGMLMIKSKPNTTITHGGITVKTDGQGRGIIGFHRDEPQSVVLKVAGTDVNVAPQKQTYRIQKITGVAQKYVTPKKDVLNRIKRDRTEKANATASITPVVFYGKEWALPISNSNARISGVYGSQRFYNGQPRSPHYGIDFALPKGTPVIAPMDGTVTLADDLYYSGNTVYIDHGGRVFSAFLHLDTLGVSVGDKVKIGQKIGTIGSTGRSTGPHLDWRIQWVHKRMNPAYLVGHTFE